MNPTDLQALVASLPSSREAEIVLAADATAIEVAGAGSLAVPPASKAGAESWLQHDAPAVYPNVPHGQPRDTLLFGILKDAGEVDGKRALDRDLRTALDEHLPGDTADKRAVVAEAMAEKFWVTKTTQEYLLPLHASLALGFDQAGGRLRDQRMRYKMFRGSVLPFLCYRSDGTVDEELIGGLLEVFQSYEDFTILDRQVLEIAAELAPPTSGPAVSALLNNESSRKALARLDEVGGAFCQPSLDLFQDDLRQVLQMPLPRRDLIEQITMLLALHLSLRLIRAAVVLSKQLDSIISLLAGQDATKGDACTMGCAGDLDRCSLAGMLRFRVGSGGFRSVSMSDPCVISFRQVTSGFLLPLPVTIAVANLAVDAFAQLGGADLGSLDLSALHAALHSSDESFRRAFDAAMRALAVMCAAQQNPSAGPDEIRRYAREGRPGLFALREAILDWRRPAMRHEGRDVVFQLVKEVKSGRLIQSNGTRVTFFEIDEALLYLLVTIICKDELVPFAEFLGRLRRYGLEPQDRDEEARLQRSLERLGMFARYSDAAESAYVHSINRTDDGDGASR